VQGLPRLTKDLKLDYSADARQSMIPRFNNIAVVGVRSIISRHLTVGVGVSSRAMATVSASSSLFPVTEIIQTKLTEAFAPQHLEVVNDSHKHNVPLNAETHFSVLIVSSRFTEEAKTPLKRHRLVNDVLRKELAADGPVHALSITAKTPIQWEKLLQAAGGNDQMTQAMKPRPACQGGDGSLPKRN
jgi:stress-induced morphogen